jgi:hypothetical protein
MDLQLNDGFNIIESNQYGQFYDDNLSETSDEILQAFRYDSSRNSTSPLDNSFEGNGDNDSSHSIKVNMKRKSNEIEHNSQDKSERVIQTASSSNKEDKYEKRRFYL